jgi:hypothetical protein
VPVIVAGLYVVRSLLRGSWRPELPMDAVILVLVGVVMVAVARLRAISSQQETDESDDRGTSHGDVEGPAV